MPCLLFRVFPRVTVDDIHFDTHNWQCVACSSGLQQVRKENEEEISFREGLPLRHIPLVPHQPYPHDHILGSPQTRHRG
jgi:hypothetical protein